MGKLNSYSACPPGGALIEVLVPREVGWWGHATIYASLVALAGACLSTALGTLRFCVDYHRLLPLLLQVR